MDWLLRRREKLLFLSTFVWQVINGVYFKLLGGLRWLRKSHRGKQRNGVGCSYYFLLPFMSALCKLTHLLVESWYVYLISWSNSSVSFCVCVCWYVSIVCCFMSVKRKHDSQHGCELPFVSPRLTLKNCWFLSFHICSPTKGVETGKMKRQCLMRHFFVTLVEPWLEVSSNDPLLKGE